MGKAEVLHELINTNLTLLKANGHHIDFKEDMFKEPNLPGFESVGYALLTIIDPVECKTKIPWPLVNDKAQAREFRTNFAKFIKKINSTHPTADIPEINASSLQFPSGIKFLDFMHKLSTFALELELRKMLSPKEQEDLIPKRKPKDPKDQEVKLKIITGAINSELESYNQIKEYEAKASKTLEQLNSCLEEIANKQKIVSDQLNLAVSSLDCDDGTKARLIDIEDDTAITDYNQRVEKKLKELEETNCKLGEIHSLSISCCQFNESSQQPLCLDGHKLLLGLNRSPALNRFLNEAAGRSVLNDKGEVNLLLVMKAVHSAVSRLTRSPVSPELCSTVRDLQVRCSSVATRSSTLESVLKRLLLENKQEVYSLRAIAYNNLKLKKVPDIFQCLKERPPLSFVLPHSDEKENIEIKSATRRKSIGTIVRHRKTVVCSYKMRREPKKHQLHPVSSTPIFKTPGVRKSPSNILSLGPRNQRKEADRTFEGIHFNVIQSSPAVTTFHKHDSTISKSSPIVAEEMQTTSPQPKMQPPCSRKSLNDVIERYRKLKATMSTTSKNESGTETGTEHEFETET